MSKAALIGAISGLALAGCMTTGAAPLPEAQPSPAQIVAARQAAFHMTGAAMGNIKGTIDRDGDPKSQAYAARGVARWARALPTMFPESSSAITPSRARAEIWANRPDFEAKAAAFAAAATQLALAAESGDKAAFTASWRATGETCAACHELYQVPQAR